jgi:hypothetical protein
MKLSSVSLALGIALFVLTAGVHESRAEPKPAAQATEPNENSQDPKDAIAYQLGLLKAGNVEKVKACFTDRLKDDITAKIIEDNKKEIARMTIEDLFASAKINTFDGEKTAKIKMKNGRTLTTLVLINGKWLADTIWFR